MTHGLKSLAQELPKHGRYGDTMVAHINPQEAALLKSLGGSGTINPVTGLPEFFGGLGAFNPFNPGSAVSKGINQIPIIGDANKAINNLGTQVFQPLEKAIVQPASAGLSQFDKAVGKTIPGGWGTVGMVAGSMMGLPTYAMVGLGALNGSGVMHPGRGFNLQGAMIGGAMAYGASQLGEYARAAGSENLTQAGGDALRNSAGTYTLPGETGDILVNSQGQLLDNAGQVLNPSAPAASGAINASSTLANSAPYVPSQDVVAQQAFQDMENGFNAGTGTAKAGPSMFDRGLSAIKNAPGNAMDYITTGAKSAYDSAGNALESATKLDTYTDALDRGMTNFGKTTSGIGNLLTGSSGTSAAAAAASGVNPMLATGATAYGAMGMMSMEEQRKHLEEAKAANAISQAEYDKALGEMNRSAGDASKAVRDNPFNANPNRDASMDPTYYGRSNEIDNLYSRMKGEDRLYADGGTVNPPDDQTGMPNESPLKNFEGGMLNNDGIRGYAVGGQIDMGNGYDPFANLPNLAGSIGGRSPDDGPSNSFAQSQSINPTSSNGFSMDNMARMAAGGMAPRFLSGGGDGMSDSIPAKINGNQEARLADGEFVVPADVVSHLGNGSSKAGANQLYSMMDKVRSARTGRKSQGKQINPRKYLPA
jgi:hypothetical protein